MKLVVVLVGAFTLTGCERKKGPPATCTVGDITYLEGQQWTLDCNTCACNPSGVWCSTVVCKPPKTVASPSCAPSGACAAGPQCGTACCAAGEHCDGWTCVCGTSKFLCSGGENQVCQTTEVGTCGSACGAK